MTAATATVLDESGVERIATDLIEDDAIREQVALIAVEQLYANVDVEQVIAERLPAAQRGLAPTLAGLSRQAADQGAEREGGAAAEGKGLSSSAKRARRLQPRSQGPATLRRAVAGGYDSRSTRPNPHAA